jgi:hypothetical protein
MVLKCEDLAESGHYHINLEERTTEVGLTEDMVQGRQGS